MCGLHVFESLDAEKLPVPQSTHFEFAVTVTGTYPWPAPHASMVAVLQGDVDRPALNATPASHCLQLESLTAEPFAKPMPSAQGKLLCGAHATLPRSAANEPLAHGVQSVSEADVPAT